MIVAMRDNHRASSHSFRRQWTGGLAHDHTAGMAKQYVQTYQKSSSRPDEPVILEPPKNAGDWRLVSWVQDTNAQFLVVVWERDLS